MVIGRKGDGLGEMFTVRRIVQGEGVERIFPLHSPKIAKIEVKRTGEVRRAKLYYLRDRVGKATRLRERKTKERRRWPPPPPPKKAKKKPSRPSSTVAATTEGAQTRLRRPVAADGACVARPHPAASPGGDAGSATAPSAPPRATCAAWAIRILARNYFTPARRARPGRARRRLRRLRRGPHHATSTTPRRPAASVDRAKQTTLTRSALDFLRRTRLLERPARFDVLILSWPAGRREPRIDHYRHAFEAVGRGQMYSDRRESRAERERSRREVGCDGS